MSNYLAVLSLMWIFLGTSKFGFDFFSPCTEQQGVFAGIAIGMSAASFFAHLAEREW